MDNQRLDLNSHSNVLENLDKLEEKLCYIINFYEELGVLRQRRKCLVDNFMQKDQIELQQGKLTLKKQVLFKEEDLSDRKRSVLKTGSVLEKKKSIAQIYDLLGNLSTYHEEVHKRINDLRLLKSQNKPDSEYKELDTILAQLQAEKDEIDNKIIQFVIKNVVEGKDELFNVITILEEDNKELYNTITFLEGRVYFLKDTVTALIMENQLFKKEDMKQDNIFRQSVVEKVSLLLPRSLRISSLESDNSSLDKLNELPLNPEQEDIPSVERSTFDSFVLDAALATWTTDEASMQAHVKRISENLEVMEVNQMKLTLLKRYVQRHGAKYINKDTLIDPSKGMSLWHAK